MGKGRFQVAAGDSGLLGPQVALNAPFKEQAGDSHAGDSSALPFTQVENRGSERERNLPNLHI